MSYVHPVDKGSRRYIAATMKAPFLEREHELDLARRWRENGDAAALHELTFSYARFVVRIASGFRGYGLPLGDLVQEGNIGLMEAAKRFDPERDIRFSTYARWWVIAAIQEYILRNSSIVRIGTTAGQKSLFFKLRRIRARLVDNPDGTMTGADRQKVAHELGVPVQRVIDAQALKGERLLEALAHRRGSSRMVGFEGGSKTLEPRPGQLRVAQAPCFLEDGLHALLHPVW